jgi:hypothetical protein
MRVMREDREHLAYLYISIFEFSTLCNAETTGTFKIFHDLLREGSKRD